MRIGIGIALSIVKFEYLSHDYHAHVRNSEDRQRKLLGIWKRVATGVEMLGIYPERHAQPGGTGSATKRHQRDMGFLVAGEILVVLEFW